MNYIEIDNQSQPDTATIAIVIVNIIAEANNRFQSYGYTNRPHDTLRDVYGDTIVSKYNALQAVHSRYNEVARYQQFNIDDDRPVVRPINICNEYLSEIIEQDFNKIFA